MTEQSIRVVVSVEGSGAPVAALRWAAEQGLSLGTDVVVHAWEPAAARLVPYAQASACPTVPEQRERAAGLLASTVHETFGSCTGLVVRAVLAEGPPGRELLQQAPGALLLVLRRTAHGQCELPTVDTVGRECLRHATVAMVTVPAPGRHTSPLRLSARLPPSGAGPPEQAGRTPLRWATP
ncbi:universal stress protein [Streptomyces rochei]|uniref:universal stress protein n=1 Tax=Streptomyces rochei TaxID=1928 RepID=UPI0033A8C5EE